MVKLTVFALCILVVLQGAWGKAKGKAAAPAPADEGSTLEQLAANAQQVVNNVTATLGLKDLDSKKVVEVLNTNAQNLANHINEITEKLKNEMTAHKPEFDNIVKSVEQKLAETATTLQNAAGPEASAKAKELKTNFDNSLKTAVAQVEKLAKAIEPDATKAKTDIQNAAKAFLDQVVQISNDVQSQVQKTIADHEKSHQSN